MRGLAAVLEAHRFAYPTHCICRRWRAVIAGDAADANGVHVATQHDQHAAAAVLAWIEERLASDEVREAVAAAIKRGNVGNERSIAALTAVTAALRGQAC